MAIVAGVDFGTLSVRVTIVDTGKGRLGSGIVRVLPPPSREAFTLARVGLGLRAGVELEGCPIERLLEDGFRVGRMEKSELGVAEGGSRVFALE
jgi:hypothetical protein